QRSATCSASLGVTVRKGNIGLPIMLATLLVVSYYLIDMAGIRWAKLGAISPWVGAWAANFMLLPLGLFLLSRAQKDAPLSVPDSLVGVWRRMQKKRENDSGDAI
ncbi:MAG: LptF/LptG family permease, partial [Bacteroidota bacterium]